jgi:acetoin:2,6-dichlorophenolindophenol oxidoreductase subunit beta
VPLGQSRLVREGGDVTLVALAWTVGLAEEAARILQEQSGISVEVIDLRCLVPLDAAAVKASVEKTGRLVIVEENPRPLGWGAELSSIVVEESFDSLDGPVLRVATEAVPLPAAPNLEDLARPSVDQIVRTVTRLL